MIRGGLFVVLEGADGSGTTTQQRLLAERLEKVGEQVTCVSQPSKGEHATAAGALIRDMLEGRAPLMQSAMATQLLFAADRVELCRRDIGPALKAGSIVVSDRHTPSSIVYSLAGTPRYLCSVCGWVNNDLTVAAEHACAPGRVMRDQHERVTSLLVEANRAATTPDLTIVLAVDPAVAAARRSARGGRPDAFEGAELQDRVCSLYRRLDWLCQDRHPIGRLRFVFDDGHAPSDVVHEAVYAHVVETLAARRAMV